jgi:hypothetical protein
MMGAVSTSETSIFSRLNGAISQKAVRFVGRVILKLMYTFLNLFHSWFQLT